MFQMKVEKALLSTDADKVNISVPFAKVDQENRIVSGFATMDNIDKGADVVTASASEKAFSNFRGNVREQHLSIAAGRVVNFRHQTFFNPDDNKAYNGIYVDAYISKGAPLTWEKVLDGTLSGFSIGGNINKADSKYEAESDKTVRYITDYDLVELSLVDSPMNPLCNVFNITKADNLVKAEGMAVNLLLENVFWCKADRIAVASEEATQDCKICSSEMNNVGWFESDNKNDKSDNIRSVLKEAGLLKTKEGGSEMENEDKTTTVEESKVEEKVEEKPKDEETSNQNKSDEIDFDSFSKALDEIKTLVVKYNESDESRNAVLKSITESVSTFQQNTSDKFDELLNKHKELANEVKSFKEDISKVESRLGDVETETVTKKSRESAGEKITKSDKSVWANALVPEEYIR